MPSVLQLGLLTSKGFAPGGAWCLSTTQRPGLKQGLFASLRTTSSGFLKSVGEGFGPLIHIHPHSVQADFIRMKPKPIHYVCSDGAQADTPPLQCNKVGSVSWCKRFQWSSFIPRYVVVGCRNPTCSGNSNTCSWERHTYTHQQITQPTFEDSDLKAETDILDQCALKPFLCSWALFCEFSRLKSTTSTINPG